MNKIYSKDDASPDSLEALNWLQNKFNVELLAKFIYDDKILKYYFTRDKSKCFLIEYSCGIYEDVYEIPLLEFKDRLIDLIYQLEIYIE